MSEKKAKEPPPNDEDPSATGALIDLSHRELEEALCQVIMEDAGNHSREAIAEAIAAGVTPEDMASPTPQAIYRVELAIDACDEHPTLINVVDELQRLGQLAALGGVAEVSRILNADNNPATAGEYASRIQYWSRERRKAKINQAIMKAVAAGDVAEEDRLRADRERLGPCSDDGKWRPQVQTMRDLMAKELPPIRWFVHGLFPEGVTLFAAKAKNGKSTMMLHISASIAAGAKAMGHFDTEQCEVLYLALEETERRMQKRMRGMLQGQTAPPGLWLAYNWTPFDQGGLTALETWLDKHPAVRKVVIDTLEHVRQKRRSPNGGYSDDYSAVTDIQQMAGKRQVGVVLIHHLRKAPAEDPFDEVNATMGLLAGVDNIMVMRRASGIMELHRRGRDYEDDTVLALKGDKSTLLWSVEGNAEDVKRGKERQAILEVLAQSPEPMGPKQIAAETGFLEGNVRFLLTKMLDAGEVIRPERAQYTIPANNANIANNADKTVEKERGEAHHSDVSDHKMTANNPNNGPVPLWNRDAAPDVSDVSDVSDDIQPPASPDALETPDGDALNITRLPLCSWCHKPAKAQPRVFADGPHSECCDAPMVPGGGHAA